MNFHLRYNIFLGNILKLPAINLNKFRKMSENELKLEPNTFELTTVNVESNQKLERIDETPVSKDKDFPQQPQTSENLPASTLKLPSPEPVAGQRPTIQTLKKENSVIKPSSVQFKGKKDEKKADSSNKLPTVIAGNTNNTSNKTLAPLNKKSNIRAATSGGSSLQRSAMKLERLKNVLEEMKSLKREKKVSSAVAGKNIRGFPDAYEQKIIE